MFQFHCRVKYWQVQALCSPPTILRFDISVYYMCNFVILFSVQNVCRNLCPTSGGVWELAVLPFSRSSSILDQEKSCCVVLVEKRYVIHALPSATPCVGKKNRGNNFLPKKETCLAVYCRLSKNRQTVWMGQFTAGRRLAKSIRLFVS